MTSLLEWLQLCSDWCKCIMKSRLEWVEELKLLQHWMNIVIYQQGGNKVLIIELIVVGSPLCPQPLKKNFWKFSSSLFYLGNSH